MKTHTLKKYILPTIIILNTILLCLIGFILVMGVGYDEIVFNVTGRVISITFLLSPIIAGIIVDKTTKKIEFFEWDKKERDKKKYFMSTLIPIVFFFTYLSLFTLTIGIIDFFKSHYTFSSDFIFLILSGIYLLMNALYTVKLHNKIYRECLYSDFIVDKPENWEKKAEPSYTDVMREWYINTRKKD